MNAFEKIEHIIVLMFENRSFDHMLGGLGKIAPKASRHPDEDFEGLTGSERNWYAPGLAPAEPEPADSYSIEFDPDHHHEAVMRQLLGRNDHPDEFPTIENTGFAWDFEQHAFRRKKGSLPGRGPEIMRYHTPDRLPVLSTLAREFAVCDNWFCSVPGQTWPNRLFTHSATSDGYVNNKIKIYKQKTVFRQLQEAKSSWRIYGQKRRGLVYVVLSLAFLDVLKNPQLSRLKTLCRRIRKQTDEATLLRNYIFVEPRYFGKRRCSQHPADNVKNGRDFLLGEQLILDIYSCLVKNPSVWKKTLLAITYDEHGGIYDHQPPEPCDSDRELRSDPASGRVFEFDLLGPRVPTVLVSPFIAKGTLDQTLYDHTSIIATVRKRFAKDADPLTGRDAWANTFDHDALWSLDEPRGEKDVPDPNHLQEKLDELKKSEGLREEKGEDEVELEEPQEFQRTLLQLNELLRHYWNRRVAPDHQVKAGVDLREPQSAVGLKEYADELRALEEKARPRVSTLRTADGSWISDPGTELIRAAIEAVASSKEANVHTSIEDTDDHFLVWGSNRTLRYLDLEKDLDYELEDVDAEAAQDLFEQLIEGRASDVEARFR